MRSWSSRAAADSGGTFDSQHQEKVQFITQVYYPSGRLSSSSLQQPQSNTTHRYLIGWNLDNFCCFVACAIDLPEGMLFQDLDDSLSRAVSDLEEVLAPCALTRPQILGQWMPYIATDYIPDPRLQASTIWITLTTGSSSSVSEPSSVHPQLHSVYSLGNRYFTSCYMIQYHSIDTDKLQCLRLLGSEIKSFQSAIVSQNNVDLSSGVACGKYRDRCISPNPSRNTVDLYRSVIDAAIDRTEVLLDHNNSATSSSITTSFIIAQINAAHDLESAILYYLYELRSLRLHSRSGITDSQFNGNFSLLLTRVNSTSPVSASKAYLQYLCSLLRNLLFSCLAAIAKIYHKTNNVIIGLLESDKAFLFFGQVLAHWVGIRGTDGIDPHLSSISLCDLSLTAAHLRERMTCINALIYQCAIFTKLWYKPAEQRLKIWQGVFRYVFLLCFDTLLGMVIGWWLLAHSHKVLTIIREYIFSWQYEYVVHNLKWFNNNPGGIKLNSFITRKIGSALLWIVRKSDRFHLSFSFAHEYLLKCLGCAGFIGGFTTQVMISIDVIRMLTIHISTIHRLFALEHHYQLMMIYSCWCLFMGQKKNILRNRIDTCTYDKQQLIFGIALFAMVILLFPSFAAYFYLFALLQLCIVALNSILWSVVIMIKELPYHFLLDVACSGGGFDLMEGLHIRLKYINWAESRILSPQWRSNTVNSELTKLGFGFISSLTSPRSITSDIEQISPSTASPSSTSPLPVLQSAPTSGHGGNEIINGNPSTGIMKARDVNKPDPSKTTRRISFDVDRISFYEVPSSDTPPSTPTSPSSARIVTRQRLASRSDGNYNVKVSAMPDQGEGDSDYGCFEEGAESNPASFEANWLDERAGGFDVTNHDTSSHQLSLSFPDLESSGTIANSGHLFPPISEDYDPDQVRQEESYEDDKVHEDRVITEVEKMSSRSTASDVGSDSTSAEVNMKYSIHDFFRFSSSSSNPRLRVATDRPGQTAMHFEISPQAMWTSKLVWESYKVYFDYFLNKRGLFWRYLRGIVTGRPSIDIQLIKATVELWTSQTTWSPKAVAQFFDESEREPVGLSTSKSNESKNVSSAKPRMRRKVSENSTLPKFDVIMRVLLQQNVAYSQNDPESAAATPDSAGPSVIGFHRAIDGIPSRGLTPTQLRWNQYIVFTVLAAYSILFLLMVAACAIFLTVLLPTQTLPWLYSIFHIHSQNMISSFDSTVV